MTYVRLQICFHILILQFAQNFKLGDTPNIRTIKDIDLCFECTPDCTVSSLNFQKFSGEGFTEPLPRPLPSIYLGLRPRFGLRPQFLGASHPWFRLHPQYSGASRPRFGLHPQFAPPQIGRPPTSILTIRTLVVTDNTLLHETFFTDG